MRRMGFVLALATLLGACGLKAPNISAYISPCPSPGLADATDRAEIFFVSSALRDCRDGDLKLSGYRFTEGTFGHALYDNDPNLETVEPESSEADEATWEETLRERIAEDKRKNNRTQSKLTVVIHGFNNSFEEAVNLAAKVAREDDGGVPLVLLHWPSRGFGVSYTFDEATAAWSQELINQRLARLTTMVDDITIVAHSMGSRLAVNGVIALDRISLNTQKGDEGLKVEPGNIRRIVLASADIDRHLVLREGGSVDLLLSPGKWDRKVAVYASYRDVPINLSRRVHAFERLGSTSCKYDVIYDRRPLGKDGNCHQAKDRPGLFLVSTSRVKNVGPFKHNDFVLSCRSRAHFRAFLRGKAALPYQAKLGVEGSDRFGYEIDPLMDAQNENCPTEER